MKNLTRQVRGQTQKELVKLFDRLAQRHSRWEVWADFVYMSAAALSNAVDKAHFEEREKDYLAIARKYNKAELEAVAEMFALLGIGMDENPDQDFLGELFMSLDLGNQYKGQFFTPYSVCRMMAQITGTDDLKARLERQGWVSVNDCCCGAGALLVAFANECTRQGVNYQTSVLFVAQDIDLTAGLMCYIQLSLLGCPGYVVIGNTLTEPSVSLDKRGLIPQDKGNVWYMPFYFRDVWHWRRVWAQMDMLFKSENQEQSDPALPEPKPPPEPVVYNATKTGQLTLYNAYLARQQAKEKILQQATAETYQQFMADTLMLTLNDPDIMGKDTFGYERLKKVAEGWSRYIDQFHPALTGSPEADYLQIKLDEGIRRIMGKSEDFSPFNERYEWISKVKYGR